MKIVDANFTMEAGHASLSRSSRSETLRMWVGNQRPDFEGRGAAARPTIVSISDAGRSEEAAAAKEASEDNLDPRMSMLKAMIEYLTGRSMRMLNVSSLECPPEAAANAASAPQRAGFGIEYDVHASQEEFELTSFSTSGTIRTSDGKEISFQLDLQMSRHFYAEQNISLRAGDAVRKDPLVINFSGNAAQLLGQTFLFDLDADGKKEEIAQLAGGSAYLALDRNGNGKVDSGAELLGPQSNNGFADLAALDDDGNGWIDEGDAAFSRLKVWQPDAQAAGSLKSLAAVGVGALSLARIATPFELRGNAQQDLGAIRETGLFLYENGGAGTLQEIDLTI